MIQNGQTEPNQRFGLPEGVRGVRREVTFVRSKKAQKRRKIEQNEIFQQNPLIFEANSYLKSVFSLPSCVLDFFTSSFICLKYR